ncbi:MAG: hypothetical protein AAB354_12450 [candidate division KSB1 bacterium]
MSLLFKAQFALQTIDELMRQKYGMSFDDFGQRNVVAEQNFSWEVESDSQDWELALDGTRTMDRKLGELNGKD